MISISNMDDDSDDVLVPPTIPYEYWQINTFKLDTTIKIKI